MAAASEAKLSTRLSELAVQRVMGKVHKIGHCGQFLRIVLKKGRDGQESCISEKVTRCKSDNAEGPAPRESVQCATFHQCPQAQ